jgi:hypothetical protein
MKTEVRGLNISNGPNNTREKGVREVTFILTGGGKCHP